MRTQPLLTIVAALGGGCAALAPDRSLDTRITLAAGQAAVGSFHLPDGGKALVSFRRHPMSGDEKIQIAFPDVPTIPGPEPLGYAHQWLVDATTCRLIVRNVSTQRVTFLWSVKGTSNVAAEWDVTGQGEDNAFIPTAVGPALAGIHSSDGWLEMWTRQP